jgi:hypothetical protein
MPGAKVLLDHEHVRMRVGQVLVPFGICVEPSNVKAAGHACPFRFRCLGCDHFRTDPSYLPDLSVSRAAAARRLTAQGHKQGRFGSASPALKSAISVARTFSRVHSFHRSEGRPSGGGPGFCARCAGRFGVMVRTCG